MSADNITIWDWTDGDPNTWESTLAVDDPQTGRLIVYNVQFAGTETENELVGVWQEVITADAPMPDGEWMLEPVSLRTRPPVGAPLAPRLVRAAFQPGSVCYVSPVLYQTNRLSLIIQRATPDLATVTGLAVFNSGVHFGFVWNQTGLAAAIRAIFGPQGLIASTVIAIGTGLVWNGFSGWFPAEEEVLSYYGCLPGAKVIYMPANY